MAHSGAASTAGLRAALLRQRGVNMLLGACVPLAGSQGKRACTAPSVYSSTCRHFSRDNLFVFKACRGTSYRPSTSCAFSTSGGVAPSYMLVEKPRPTEYQTEICNEATDVKPGVEKSSTKGLILLTTLLIVVPIVHTKYELHKYYSEYGRFYKTGWDLYHYDKGKSTYLS